MTLRLSNLIDGFILAKKIAGMSQNTVRNYRLSLHRLAGFFGENDPTIEEISLNDLRQFLNNLQTLAVAPPGCAPRPARPLSPKSIENVHTCLSSFWSWAVEEGYAVSNIVRKIKPPQPQETVIEPFSREQIKAMLYECRNSRDTLRDRAIIRFLLDNGVRASELCSIQVGDVNLERQKTTVWGKSRMSGGQGKQRIIPFGERTTKVLWEYISRRQAKADDFLFVNADGSQIDRRTLGKHLKRLGQRAGVTNVYPHRFRHTFAIEYLRNGGDIFTLQRVLGHSSLDMVKRYLAIANIDIEAAHRRAGPVDQWKL